jgi:hypothetical protein
LPEKPGSGFLPEKGLKPLPRVTGDKAMPQKTILAVDGRVSFIWKK